MDVFYDCISDDFSLYRFSYYKSDRDYIKFVKWLDFIFNNCYNHISGFDIVDKNAKKKRLCTLQALH